MVTALCFPQHRRRFFIEELRKQPVRLRPSYRHSQQRSKLPHHEAHSVSAVNSTPVQTQPKTHTLERSHIDNIDMNETDIGAWEDNAMTSRFILISTLCFTTMTTLHGNGKLTDSPFVIIAQSSAVLVPHILGGPPYCSTPALLGHTLAPSSERPSYTLEPSEMIYVPQTSRSGYLAT